jgi:hypothetical protein
VKLKYFLQLFSTCSIQLLTLHRMQRNWRTYSPHYRLKSRSKMLYNIRSETFVFETHVTAKWGRTLLSSVICHDDKDHCYVYSTHTMYSSTKLWSIMEYAYNECCNVLLNLSVSVNIRAGADARDWELRCSDGRHTNTNVLRRLGQRLRETASQTPTVLV